MIDVTNSTYDPQTSYLVSPQVTSEKRGQSWVSQEVGMLSNACVVWASALLLIRLKRETPALCPNRWLKHYTWISGCVSIHPFWPKSPALREICLLQRRALQWHWKILVIYCNIEYFKTIRYSWSSVVRVSVFFMGCFCWTWDIFAGHAFIHPDVKYKIWPLTCRPVRCFSKLNTACISLALATKNICANCAMYLWACVQNV